MKYLDIIALILLIVGGLNWLLVGAFNFDLVATISGGATTPLAKIIYIHPEIDPHACRTLQIYIIVGICAIYSIKFLAPLFREP
jgi:uncharacterized membrane protein YuzA (DUF378 family)